MRSLESDAATRRRGDAAIARADLAVSPIFSDASRVAPEGRFAERVAASRRVPTAASPCRRGAASACGALLASMVLLGACTGGGGGGEDSNPIEWGRLRHDNSNSGLAGGNVGNNRGTIQTLLQLDAAGYGLTSSTP